MTPEVGDGAVVPCVVDVTAVAADHVDGRQVARRRETGCDDEGVDSSFAAVGGDDRVARDALDRVGDELQVGPVEGLVVVVGDQRPLAAVRMRGDELWPYLGILDDLDRGEARRLRASAFTFGLANVMPAVDGVEDLLPDGEREVVAEAASRSASV